MQGTSEILGLMEGTCTFSWTHRLFNGRWVEDGHKLSAETSLELRKNVSGEAKLLEQVDEP